MKPPYSSSYDLENAIRTSLTGFEDDYDVPSAASEYMDLWGRTHIDDVDPELYWDLLSRHDRSKDL